uniref:Leucine rich repeat neuronal 1 n=1 Tax=Eptatretus burgeri TaxID=7764 RepID=A0A8C4NNU9_EPTBU
MAEVPWSVAWVCLFLLIRLRAATCGECPPMCVCELRPWFTPQSLYQEAHTVDCAGFKPQYNFTAFPTETQVLLLQSSGLESTAPFLKGLTNLTELDVSQNRLLSIEAAGLVPLSHLVTLHLEENGLTLLPDRSLRHLAALQELYLNHNRIDRISPDAFAGLDNLTRLHINSNLLRAIDHRWFLNTPNMEVLMVGENPVDAILAGDFAPLSNLNSLVLAGMGLLSIPEGALFGLSSLESLSLYNNRLKEVPWQALQSVTDLKFLDLNKNPIRTLKEGDFRNMVHLKELGMSSMPELVAIDRYALENLPELIKVEATHNPKLAFVHPHALRELPHLETLMLSDNNIAALYRQTVESLPSLREIGLHGNPLHCDCIVQWIIRGQLHARFMEPHAMHCAAPPEFMGQCVRDIPMTDIPDGCLPFIPTAIFPEVAKLLDNTSATFDCRALAEPEPVIYWVTPKGKKIVVDMVSEKYSVSDEGTLQIMDAHHGDSGTYTCVAQNGVGLDTKTVTVTVNGSHVNPSQGITIRVLNAGLNSVLVAWTSQPGPHSTSATLHISNEKMSPMTRAITFIANGVPGRKSTVCCLGL